MKKVVILDVEGTTTPVSFVYEVLFPYARERLDKFLKAEEANEGVCSDLRTLRAEYVNDEDPEKPEWREAGSPIPYLTRLIDIDRKSPALKSIQGKIWEVGFRDGTIRGEIFPDVAPAFRRWSSAGVKVAIYSSGSVQAQRLLFSHSTAGDLAPYISAYFDTSVGPKRAPSSYREIAHILLMQPHECLFVSDVKAELDAAVEAEMAVCYSVRPGNKYEEKVPYRSIQSFEALF